MNDLINNEAASGGQASSLPMMGGHTEPTIFELSMPTRRAGALRSTGIEQVDPKNHLPTQILRESYLELPEVSERDLVAHYTRLSHRQYAVDLGFYPLGSCTMKYNPKLADHVASIPGLVNVHPHTPSEFTQGWLAICVTLEKFLTEITGMDNATLAPAAGAQGELTGLLIMRAYHRERGNHKTKILIPDSAHGTNPASVTLAGYHTVTVPSNDKGQVDTQALRALVDESTAGIMLTNPNTVGLFEADIREIAEIIHGVDGLLYYDGANLNAIVGVARPGDMGFDIVHSNLHKTFATPHGGGGPGSGPVAVVARLAPFLPGPYPTLKGGRYDWITPSKSIGRVHSFYGNAIVYARALAYMKALGTDGLLEMSRLAVLNANYLLKKISADFPPAFESFCMHEFVVSASVLKKNFGVRAIDIAKAMLDEGFHSPTVNFPLIIEEALMIEPTETESLQTLNALAASLIEIAQRAQREGGAEELRSSPKLTPVSRVDEARAARNLITTFDARPNAIESPI